MSVLSASAIAASPLTWGSAALVDHQPPYGQPNAVSQPSCPTIGFCVAVDNHGNVLTSSNPTGDARYTWQVRNIRPTDPLVGVSCPSSSVCVAIDISGAVITSDAPDDANTPWQWTEISTAAPLTGISCPSTSFCAAVNGRGQLFTSTYPLSGASAWSSATIDGTNVLTAISCPSAALCVATDQDGNVLTSTNPSGGADAWTAAKVDSSHLGLRSVSCAGGLCILADSAGSVLTSANPTAGADAWTSADIDLTTPLASVSCASATLCVAGDTQGNLLYSTAPTAGNDAWYPAAVDGATSLAVTCVAGQSLCVAGDSEGDVLDSTNPSAGASAWSSPALVDPGIAYLDGLACPDASLCVAVDRGGNVATSNDPSAGANAWQVTNVVSGDPPETGLTGVACSSTQLCVAVDQNTGKVLTSTNPAAGAGAWSATATGASGLDGISCAPASTLCVAVDENGDVVTSTNPTGGSGAWQSAHVASSILRAVSCPSTSLCVATENGGGTLLTSTNPTGGASAWKPVSVSGLFEPSAVSCPSPSFCAVVDAAGNVATATDPAGGAGAWVATNIDGTTPLSAISCPSASLCAATDANGQALVATDPTGGATAWTAKLIDDYYNNLSAVSCPSAAICVAVDQAGNAFLGQANAWSGMAPAGQPQWSNPANWAGQNPPTGSVGTLRFPMLSPDACAASPPTAACYNSVNDLSSVSATGLAIDAGGGYTLSGNAVTLGSAGITATTSSSFPKPSVIMNPLLLAADQTWSMDGGSSQNGQLDVGGTVSGDSALRLGLSNRGILSLDDADDEIGTVTVSGAEGTSSSTNGFLGLANARLNATNGNPVSLTHAGLLDYNGTVGPLTSSAGSLSVQGSLTVNGDFRTDGASSLLLFITQAGTTPVTDYAQLNVGGAVTLSGSLALLAMGSGNSCPAFNVGDVETLITSSGPLSGTFSGIPDGSTVGVGNCAEGRMRINYTPHAVTATYVGAPPYPVSGSQPTISGSPEQGQTLSEQHAEWSGSPSSYSYQWERCDSAGGNCVPIAGATSPTYTASGDDVGSTIVVLESAANAAGTTYPVASDPTAVVASAPPTSPPAANTPPPAANTPPPAANTPPPAANTPPPGNTTPTTGNPAMPSAGATNPIADPVAPGVEPSAPTVLGSTTAGFSGSVNPEGLATTAYFQYGLDSKYGGGSAGPSYTQATAPQTVGSDTSAHPISTSVTGLVPHAVYHLRLVAISSAGTTYGADQTFMTRQDAPPPPPVLGQSVDVKTVSGVVLIKPPPGKTLGLVRGRAAQVLAKGEGFVPLTEARQIPSGSQIDARRGSLQVIAAAGQAGKTQAGVFGGALFALKQSAARATKGLTTLSLLDGGFPGAPTYASCAAAAADASSGTAGAAPVGRAARMSSRVLQTLHASDHGGRFATRGRYSAATVRGTVWDTVDRCDGTLTVVHRGIVAVSDFVRHMTVILRAGQSYLARAPSRHG